MYCHNYPKSPGIDLCILLSTRFVAQLVFFCNKFLLHVKLFFRSIISVLHYCKSYHFALYTDIRKFRRLSLNMADGLKDNLMPVLAMSKEFSSLGFVLVACNWRDLEFHDMSFYILRL